MDITHELHAISPTPIAYGGFADIYDGIWRHGGEDVKVAIKVLRVRTLDTAGEKLLRQLRREITVWKRLYHANIHILCGLCEGLGPAPAMVSPWYSNGDINSYIARHATDPENDVLKLKLFLDVVTGLNFLHECRVVHGDVKGGNVLISDDGVARLCDFGLSRLLAEHSRSTTSYSGVKGTSRWMAPELIIHGERHTYASDIWAAGCLWIEVWSAVRPYHTKTHEQQVIIAFSRGEAPDRPPNMIDWAWSQVQACCNFDPLCRSTLPELIRSITIHLIMCRLSHLMARGRTLDGFDQALLNIVESRLPAVDLSETTRLSAKTESDLAVEIVSLVSRWNLDVPAKSQLYTEALSRWCLDTVCSASGHHSLSSTGAAYDIDSINDTYRLPSSTLRPLARLLSVLCPSKSQFVMLRFGRVSIHPPMKFQHRPSSVAWFPDGERIAVGLWDGMVQILSSASGAIRHRLCGHSDYVRRVIISPNGKLLASCSFDGSIRLWDAEWGTAIGEPMLGHTDAVLSLAFSPDGTYIASGSKDRTVLIWSTNTRTMVVSPLRGHTSNVMCVAYSPDGSRIVSASWDSSLRIWDAHTGACVVGPLHGHADAIYSVAFSPDGLRFVSGSYDKTVRMWDALTGEPVGVTLEVHAERVLCVAYSPDGTRIVSGSKDRMVRIWNAATGVLVHRPLQGHSRGVYSVAFSPDGRKLASVSSDCSIRFWDAMTQDSQVEFTDWP